MDEHRHKRESERMRMFAIGASVVAIIFLVLTIVFIILFATKSTTCTSPNVKTYYVVGVDQSTSYSNAHGDDYNNKAQAQIRSIVENAGFTLYNDPAIEATQQYNDPNTNGVFVYAAIIVEGSPNADDLEGKLHPARSKRAATLPMTFTITKVFDSATELCLNNAYVTPYYTGPPGPTTTPGTASTTPQTGTTQCGNPSQEDYDFPCHPYLIYRDIVLLVDVIPTPSETTKTSQLQSFLANFTEHLLPSQAYSQPITRLALGSYDKNGLRTTNMRFSTDQTDWQKQISDVMADAGNPNIGGQNLYAALDKALDSFQYQLQFRDHTDAMIIIVTDHMSADNSSQASYTDPTKDIAEKLKGDGFWIAAIAPTFKGGIYTQLQSIVTNPNDVSVRNGISYCPEWALLTSACVSFAKTQACQYLYPNTATLPPTTPYTGPTTPYVSTSTTTGATTVTTTQAPNAETHCQVLDILFVLDESESITEPHFRQITNFTARIAELYTFCGSVNPDVTDCTKMAAIKFGDYAEPIITFNQAYSSKFFSETVTNTGYDLGKTNTDDALHLAETFFTNPSYGSRPNVQRVIVLITDGHHSEGTTDPKAQASNLRIQEGVTIISIGVNGTNGGYSPIDTEELNNITGDPKLVFPSISVDSLDDSFAQKVIALFPCPIKPCKGLTFLVETSEVVSIPGIIKSLQDVLVISDAVHAADNLTQFALVTFSSVNETHVHRILGQDHTYATWQSYLTDFANNLTDNNSPFYPFFQGHSDISTGIFTTYQVIANAKQRNYNFQGSTVIFAQTSLNEFDDGLDIAVVSRMLQSVSPKLYGVNKLSNTNYDIWTTILGSNAYHLYEDYNSTSNVATQLEPVIVDYMNNLTCLPPRILDCQQYLDIVFVIHLSSVREHMNQTGEFLKRLALSYHLDTKYVHVGIVAYDSMTRFNNGWKFGFMSQADFNNMIDEIVHDTLGDTHNNITAPLWDVKNMIGFSRGYSIDGNRQFAADVIMYITDDVDHISSDDVMNARNYIYDTTDLNMPHVVIVAINTNASFANATFNNMQSVDMDLAVFAIESYDMLNTTVVNGADYEVNWINNYVCGLLPQSLPFYCVPGQRPTTIAPPTIPPAAQCHAMDIIFVVDMSQSPNGETLKRRYKELVHQLGSEISARTVFFSDPEFIDDFQNEKNMLKNITDTFPDGHYGPPVGVQFAEVSFFDRNTNITFYLNDANSQGGYDALIQSMLPFTGDTFIDVGLNAVKNQMLNVNRGYRSNVPTIVVLFSDGNDNNGSHAIDAATALINSGVSIFALYNNASDSSPNVPLLQYITQDKSRVMPLDLYYTLKQPFYDVINNFIKTTGVDPCHPPVYADIVFVMDHSENQVRAGEVGATTPVDYVVYQKILIKNIISQLGVSTRGHRYTLVHFSDGNSYQVPGTTSYTNKTGILFDTTESYVQSVMFGKIDSFPELNAGGATDLKLVMDIISNSVVPLIANITDPFPTRLTYMVVFTTGFHDNETNCCGDPLYSALRVQNSFKPDTIIPVMSGKLADRNATLLLEYTGYNNQLPLYDVKQNSTADSIVQTIQDAISAQKAINDARQTI